MSLILHRADDRGRAEHGWLSSRFSFSFAEWYEPTRMGFGALRVLNDDTIAPSSGFGMHPHRDMEIVTIVTEGAVSHEDSEGNKGVVSAGDVQVMSAGTGVLHSEYNRSPDTTLKLFQIWITPKEQNAPVRYGEKHFDFLDPSQKAIPLVAPLGQAKHGELEIGQDAWLTYLHSTTEPFEYRPQKKGNGVYVFVADGAAEVAGVHLSARDALGVSDEESFRIEGKAEVLLLDVPLGV